MSKNSLQAILIMYKWQYGPSNKP